jgi:Bax protein
MMAFLLPTVACTQPDSAHDSHLYGKYADADTFHFAGVEELREYFAAANYTLADWQAGERSIPRYYLASVPGRWRKEVAPELPVELKKRYFFFVYAPLVLECNDDIAADRARLLSLAGKKRRSAEDEAWLHDLARRYFLDTEAEVAVSEETLAELKKRVDTIPPSLALAQAAVESGWSTSRFADVGNALFGQWTWGDDGITPQEQRDGMGNYKIKAFATPEASIAAYMHNLNTHRGYVDLRNERARRRTTGESAKGSDLARYLQSYSEKGEEYIDTLLSVIRVNRLDPVDDSYLRDMRPVMLVPVGPGSD